MGGGRCKESGGVGIGFWVLEETRVLGVTGFPISNSGCFPIESGIPVSRYPPATGKGGATEPNPATPPLRAPATRMSLPPSSVLLVYGLNGRHGVFSFGPEFALLAPVLHDGVEGPEVEATPRGRRLTRRPGVARRRHSRVLRPVTPPPPGPSLFFRPLRPAPSSPRLQISLSDVPFPDPRLHSPEPLPPS